MTTGSVSEEGCCYSSTKVQVSDPLEIWVVKWDIVIPPPSFKYPRDMSAPCGIAHPSKQYLGVRERWKSSTILVES